ncbi:hypothetical protein BGZ58_002187 [Dissophora ornata]|nr:hypothetical protein BGZ58_002187 [Dissophora ornata]
MSSLSPELSARLNPGRSGGIPMLDLAGESRDNSTITNTASTATSPALNTGEHDYDDLLNGAPDGVNGSAGGGRGSMSTLPPIPVDDIPTGTDAAAYGNMGSSAGGSTAGGGGQGADVGHDRRATITTGVGGVSGVSEIKLRRFLEHNQRLREQYDMPRIPVSEASRR